MKKLLFRSGILLLLVALTGCGGTKVLKESQPIERTQLLATVSDKRVTATLDWVIVRDGPGTWARNANWEEYLLRVRNQSDQPRFKPIGRCKHLTAYMPIIGGAAA